jgi:hypothetical protein
MRWKRARKAGGARGFRFEEAETLFSIIMNINSPISQSEMDSINFSLDNEGELPSEK